MTRMAAHFQCTVNGVGLAVSSCGHTDEMGSDTDLGPALSAT
jgi:hypothetical protein